MATVKEAREKIEELNNIYNNMLKIQNTILNNENGAEMATSVEELCGLDNTLRNLASLTAKVVSDEMKRIETIIDNTVVQLK